MWKQYSKPTKSWQAKIKDPPEGREQHGLSRALQELKEDFKLEVTCHEEQSKNQRETSETLQRQISVLRSAFSDMADAFVEELESLRSELKSEVKRQREELYERIEELMLNSKHTQDTHHQLNAALTSTTRQTLSHLQILRDKQDKLAAEIGELQCNNKENHPTPSSFFEELKQIIQTNSGHISSLFKDREKFQENMKKKMDESFKQTKKSLKNKIQALYHKLDGIEGRPEQIIETKVESSSEETQYLINLLRNDLEIKIGNLEAHIQPPDSRIEFIEEMQTTQRRELFANLAALEQTINRKHEAVRKAMSALAQHTNMPETMLAI